MPKINAKTAKPIKVMPVVYVIDTADGWLVVVHPTGPASDEAGAYLDARRYLPAAVGGQQVWRRIQLCTRFVNADLDALRELGFEVRLALALDEVEAELANP